jgi:hypothetical protein
MAAMKALRMNSPLNVKLGREQDEAGRLDFIAQCSDLSLVGSLY